MAKPGGERHKPVRWVLDPHHAGRVTVGGWRIECSCGFVTERTHSKMAAGEKFADHQLEPKS